MKVKQIPGDFVVDEIIKLKLVKEKSNYLIFRLTKENWEIFKLLQIISRTMNVKNKFVGYAGNKDKVAVTTQYISFYKIPRERIERIKINGVKLEFVGYSKERINLGDLEGNNFNITIRDLKKEVNLPGSIQLENYFGEQRFGNKYNTHLVGKAIIKKDFKKACELLNIHTLNKDYVGELRKQPRRLLRFYISSYQAFIWNKLLAKELSSQKNHFKTQTTATELVFVRDKMKDFSIPLISFDTKMTPELKSILNEEAVLLGDFVINKMPELITETSFRKAFIEVNEINYKYSKDELNSGKLKLLISFFLPKGCYATILLKKLESYLN